MVAKNKRLIGIVLTASFLLLIPLISMQFTTAVNWTLIDFFVAGGLLLGTGFTVEFVLRKVKKFNYRIPLLLGLLVILLLVWIELAVGIFGTPLSGS